MIKKRATGRTVQLTEFLLMLILNFSVTKWATSVINILTVFANTNCVHYVILAAI